MYFPVLMFLIEENSASGRCSKVNSVPLRQFKCPFAMHRG